MTAAPTLPTCAHVACRDRLDPVAWAWDGSRWMRLCNAHLAGLARVADLGVYAVDWTTSLEGPPPLLPGPARKVETDLSDTPPPEPAVHAARESARGASLPPEPPCTSSSPSSVAAPPSAPVLSGSAPVASPSARKGRSSSGSGRGRIPPRPPVRLAADADAHPERCRAEGCDTAPKVRGLCSRCFQACLRQERLDIVGLPGMDPITRARRAALAAAAKRNNHQGTPA